MYSTILLWHNNTGTSHLHCTTILKETQHVQWQDVQLGRAISSIIVFIYTASLLKLAIPIINLRASIHEILQPRTAPTPYWLWRVHILVAIEPQANNQRTINLKHRKNAFVWIPTLVHHRHPGLTLYPCRHLVNLRAVTKTSMHDRQNHLALPAKILGQ